jgi:hypothetical protein
MSEQHGDFVISEATSEEHQGQFDVMNMATGHVRWFDTVEKCRQFIGAEDAPGLKWEAVPLDEDGKPLADAATVTADDEESAKEAGRSWFHFTGVYRIKDVKVTRK